MTPNALIHVRTDVQSSDDCGPPPEGQRKLVSMDMVALLSSTTLSQKVHILLYKEAKHWCHVNIALCFYFDQYIHNKTRIKKTSNWKGSPPENEDITRNQL